MTRSIGVAERGSSHSETSLLLQEFSHRISNEFTSAIGLIAVAARGCADGSARAALNAVQDQLHNLAQVHHALQMPESILLTDACAHLQRLCRAISRSKLESSGIELIFISHPLRMNSERCWRLGLIVSELVTNSARHAFEGRYGGTIRVEILSSSSFVHCLVTDNGAGNRGARPGRGLKIVGALAESLGGAIEHHFGPKGTTAALIFPLNSQRES